MENAISLIKMGLFLEESNRRLRERKLERPARGSEIMNDTKKKVRIRRGFNLGENGRS